MENDHGKQNDKILGGRRGRTGRGIGPDESAGVSKQGVALADVQERIAQVDTMVLRGQTTFTSVSDPNISLQYDNMKYYQPAPWLRRRRLHQGDSGLPDCPEPAGEAVLLQLVPWKKCLRFPCTEEQIQVMEKLTPTGVVDLLLETDYKELGVSQIDGVEVEGFEVQDLRPLENIVPKFLLDIQQGTATIWVGTKELLPVRGEADMVIGANFWTGFMDVRCHEVTDPGQLRRRVGPEAIRHEHPRGLHRVQVHRPGSGETQHGRSGHPARRVRSLWIRFKGRWAGRTST